LARFDQQKCEYDSPDKEGFVGNFFTDVWAACLKKMYPSVNWSQITKTMSCDLFIAILGWLSLFRNWWSLFYRSWRSILTNWMVHQKCDDRNHLKWESKITKNKLRYRAAFPSSVRRSPKKKTLSSFCSTSLQTTFRPLPSHVINSSRNFL
jgi:hypothetical protein